MSPRDDDGLPRPHVPAWWRIPLAGAALYALAIALGALAPVVPAIFFLRQQVSTVFLAGLVLGVALGVGMALRERRDRLGALAGLALAVAFAVALEAPLHAFLVLGLTMPLGLLVARPDPLPTALAGAGLAGLLVAALLAMRRLGPPPSPLDALVLVAGLLASAGFALYAVRLRAAPGRPAPRRVRLSLVGAGVALLALGLLVGGHLFWVPLWPLSFGLVLAPSLARWRLLPAAVAALILLAGVGAAPVWTCTADPWSDAVAPGREGADAYPEPVTLFEIAGSGPRWASGGGFTGLAVRCPDAALAVAGGWAVALVGLSAWIAARPEPGASGGLVPRAP